MAALGLSALLATSAVALTVVKMAGAAYLVYLGVKLLFSRTGAADIQSVTTKESSAYLQGILTNALNPKVALFFLALLP